MSPDFKCACGCGQTVHRTSSKVVANTSGLFFVDHDHEARYRAEHPETRGRHIGTQDWRKILLGVRKTAAEGSISS